VGDLQRCRPIQAGDEQTVRARSRQVGRVHVRPAGQRLDRAPVVEHRAGGPHPASGEPRGEQDLRLGAGDPGLAEDAGGLPC
jgi:hypothetical protein